MSIFSNMTSSSWLFPLIPTQKPSQAAHTQFLLKFHAYWVSQLACLQFSTSSIVLLRTDLQRDPFRVSPSCCRILLCFDHPDSSGTAWNLVAAVWMQGWVQIDCLAFHVVLVFATVIINYIFVFLFTFNESKQILFRPQNKYRQSYMYVILYCFGTVE
jgi:hypothetical protein